MDVLEVAGGCCVKGFLGDYFIGGGWECQFRGVGAGEGDGMELDVGMDEVGSGGEVDIVYLSKACGAD